MILTTNQESDFYMTTKTTTKKTTKTAAAVQQINGEALAQSFIAAGEARQAARIAAGADCKTIIADINAFKNVAFSRQLDTLIQKDYFTADALAALAADMHVSEEKDQRFIGVKVITKIRTALEALALDQKSQFDKYTNSILHNLCKNQELSNKSALVSLSKSIEYHQDEQEAHIVKLINCSPSTASTQASSSRMMMRALGLAHVTKRKAKDVITPADSAAARAVVAMYAL